MRMKTLSAALIAAAALLPTTALADAMSYAFIQLDGILDAEADPEGLTAAEGDGLGVEAGWIFGPYIFTDLRYHDYDLGGIDGEETSVRLGARTQLPTVWPIRVDLYGMISYEDVEYDAIVRGFSSGVLRPVELIDDNGVGLHAGLRFSPVNWFELMGELNYSDIGTLDGEFFTVGLQVNTSNWFAINLRYRTGDYSGRGRDLEVDALYFGLRIQWGGG